MARRENKKAPVASLRRGTAEAKKVAFVGLIMRTVVGTGSIIRARTIIVGARTIVIMARAVVVGTSNSGANGKRHPSVAGTPSITRTPASMPATAEARASMPTTAPLDLRHMSVMRRVCVCRGYDGRRTCCRRCLCACDQRKQAQAHGEGHEHIVFHSISPFTPRFLDAASSQLQDGETKNPTPKDCNWRCRAAKPSRLPP